MDKNPLVSIITIFHNEESFLAESVESVINQEYSNWELLLVDDGSDDKSTFIAKEYSNRLPNRIKYIEHENHQNRGRSISRNIGITSSKGDSIAFLDADDIWYPNKIVDQVSLLNSNAESSLIVGNYEFWYSWSENENDGDNDYVFGLSDLIGINNSLVNPPCLLIALLENYDAMPLLSSFLIKKDAVVKLGGFQDSFKHLCDDRVFYTKICLNEKVYVSDSCWVKYRQHDQSCGNLATEKELQYYYQKNFLLWLEIYLSSINYKDERIFYLLQSRLESSDVFLKEKEERITEKYNKQLIKEQELRSRIINEIEKKEQLKEKLKIEKEKRSSQISEKNNKIEALKNRINKLEKTRGIVNKILDF